MTSVAFLVDQLYAPAPGGMGTYVSELLPALSRADPSLELRPFHSRLTEEELSDIASVVETAASESRAGRIGA